MRLTNVPRKAPAAHAGVEIWQSGFLGSRWRGPWESFCLQSSEQPNLREPIRSAVRKAQHVCMFVLMGYDVSMACVES